MSKTNSKEREAIRQVYPGRKWSNKVDAMSDQQVAAVYLRFKAAGKVA